MAEIYAGRVAALLAANAYFDILAGLTAALNGHFYKFTDPVLVYGLEWIQI